MTSQNAVSSQHAATVFTRIDEAKRRATDAIRGHNLSGRENAELMSDVAIDAALPVLLGPERADATDIRYEAKNVIRWLMDLDEGHEGHHNVPCVPCQAIYHLAVAIGIWEFGVGVDPSFDKASAVVNRHDGTTGSDA